ncbi:unnamed protein product [Arctia plantaginis]|nr:unnamed protein product [Arctia plantaginis]
MNNFNIKLPRVKLLKRKDKILTPRTRHASYHSSMSNKTKDFLHKLINKKSPQVDMTQYGFIRDKKMYPTSTSINPLKAQLNKLIGRPTEKIIIPRYRPPTIKKSSSKRSYLMSGGSNGSRSMSMSSGPSNRTSMSIQASPQNKQAKKRWG